MSNSSREERRLRAIDRQLDAPNGEKQPAVPMQSAQSGLGKKKYAWLLLSLCLVGSGIVSFIYFRSAVLTTPPELVGTWEVTQGPLKGSTMQFRPHGTAVLSKGKPGDEDTFSVKVENNKIFLSGKDSRTGKNDTFVQTIISLTEDELVIRDEDRVTYRMVRVRK